MVNVMSYSKSLKDSEPRWTGMQYVLFFWKTEALITSRVDFKFLRHNYDSLTGNRFLIYSSKAVLSYEKNIDVGFLCSCLVHVYFWQSVLREVYCPPVNVVCFRWSNVLNIISSLDPPKTLCLETEQSALFGRDIMPVC